MARASRGGGRGVRFRPGLGSMTLWFLSTTVRYSIELERIPVPTGLPLDLERVREWGGLSAMVVVISIDVV